jgi:hypothetical protein
MVEAHHLPVTPIQTGNIGHGDRFDIRSGPQGVGRIQGKKRNVARLKFTRHPVAAQIDPATSLEHGMEGRKPPSRQSQTPRSGELAFAEEPACSATIRMVTSVNQDDRRRG